MWGALRVANGQPDQTSSRRCPDERFTRVYCRVAGLCVGDIYCIPSRQMGPCGGQVEGAAGKSNKQSNVQCWALGEAPSPPVVCTL